MEIRPILSALLRSKTAPLLVAAQVAISLAVLANALFIVQLRLVASARPTGIDDEHAIAYARVQRLDRRPHNEALARQDRDLAVIRGVPGVVSGTLTSQMPISRSGSSGSVRADPASVREAAHPAIYFAGPGFIQTLGLKLVEGRDFTAADVREFDPDNESAMEKQLPGMIITRALGQALFPQEGSYVGRNVYIGMSLDKPTRIMGVVERLQSPQAQTSAEGEQSMILPVRASNQFVAYAFRTEPGDRSRVLLAVEEAVRKASDRPLRVTARTVDEDRVSRYRNERALAWMLMAVSALLLVVTASGIVGMTMLRVMQRRKQIGVRRALGARWADIVRYFVTENILITSGGIVAGLFMAIGLNQFLMRQLEMSRLPLGYLAFGAGALWLLGIAAVWGPASRAAHTAPAIATRTA